MWWFKKTDVQEKERSRKMIKLPSAFQGENVLLDCLFLAMYVSLRPNIQSYTLKWETQNSHKSPWDFFPLFCLRFKGLYIAYQEFFKLTIWYHIPHIPWNWRENTHKCLRVKACETLISVKTRRNNMNNSKQGKQGNQVVHMEDL